MCPATVANILPLVRDPALRHFVDLADLAVVAERLHPCPTLVPAFLVFHGRYVIDWFPAPLPAPGEAADPRALVGLVRSRLQRYEERRE